MREAVAPVRTLSTFAERIGDCDRSQSRGAMPSNNLLRAVPYGLHRTLRCGGPYSRTGFGEGRSQTPCGVGSIGRSHRAKDTRTGHLTMTREVRVFPFSNEPRNTLLSSIRRRRGLDNRSSRRSVRPRSAALYANPRRMAHYRKPGCLGRIRKYIAEEEIALALRLTDLIVTPHPRGVHCQR